MFFGLESLLGALTLMIIGYTMGSFRIIDEGDEALVQRLGQYKRTLRPGLNFVVPVIDTVLTETVREQLLDIKPHKALTKDNVSLEADAIVFWRILDLRKAYYEVQDLEEALKQLVITNLRAEIGQLDLQEVVASTPTINQALLRTLDEATSHWGVKVIRVEVQEVILPQAMTDALQKERIAKSEGKAELERTQATVKSLKTISEALQEQTNSQDVLRYLVAKEYMQANLALGQSDNSKILFMNPGALNEALSELITHDKLDAHEPHHPPSNGNS
jgi:regulator of protease activity HflC (stomatin/prohibitin superfamily)